MQHVAGIASACTPSEISYSSTCSSQSSSKTSTVGCDLKLFRGHDSSARRVTVPICLLANAQSFPPFPEAPSDWICWYQAARTSWWPATCAGPASVKGGCASSAWQDLSLLLEQEQLDACLITWRLLLVNPDARVDDTVRPNSCVHRSVSYHLSGLLASPVAFKLIGEQRRVITLVREMASP